MELNACDGGCAGGTLTVENAYIAATKTKRLTKYQPVSRNHLSENPELQSIYWADDVEYEPVFRLGNTFKESLRMMSDVEKLTAMFPGLDCGSCGAPTCQTLAEDIVRGDATPNDCIYVLRSNIAELSRRINDLTENVTRRESAVRRRGRTAAPLHPGTDRRPLHPSAFPDKRNQRKD